MKWRMCLLWKQIYVVILLEYEGKGDGMDELSEGKL